MGLHPELDELKAWVKKMAADESLRFDAALDEATVAAAEASLGIAFPDEYRRFLLEVAAGHGNGAFQYALKNAQAEGGVAEPFPFASAQAREALVNRQPIEEGDGCKGSFVVWDHGCGEESRLVVTGAERGRVWRRLEAGWIPEDGAVPPDVGDAPRYWAWLKYWSTVW